MYFVALTITFFMMIIFLILMLNIWGKLLKKVPPNMALIKYGRGGMSVVSGGAAWVWPLFERSAVFSLEVLAFDLAGIQCVTAEEAPVSVQATALLRVRRNQESILLAAGQFLSKSDAERRALLQPLLINHLRSAVGQMTVAQLIREPALVNEQLRQSSLGDLTSLGLEMISFTIRNIHEARGDETTRISGPISLERIE